MTSTTHKILLGLVSIFFVLTPLSYTASPSHVLVPKYAVASDGGAGWASFGQWSYKEIADALVWALINAAIEEIATSIVDWINSGFDGSPSFVLNFEDLARSIEYDELSEFIYGDTLAQLCSPFALDVKVALILDKERDKVTCNLGDTFDNAEDTLGEFFNGDFAAGGWEGWFEVTQNENKNPYGAYNLAQFNLDAKIDAAKKDKDQEVAVGRGFLSLEQCDPVEPTLTTRTGSDGVVEDTYTYHKDNCYFVTPGTVIETQLESALKIGSERLIVADEVDEIVGAFVAFLAKEAITGAGGLLGLSGGNPDTGEKSYLDLLRDASTEPRNATNSIGYFPPGTVEMIEEGGTPPTLVTEEETICTINEETGQESCETHSTTVLDYVPPTVTFECDEEANPEVCAIFKNQNLGAQPGTRDIVGPRCAPSPPKILDDTILFDELTDGRSSGKVSGGRFTKYGWEHGVGDNQHIVYDLGETMESGIIEFKATGFSPSTVGGHNGTKPGSDRSYYFGLFNDKSGDKRKGGTDPAFLEIRYNWGVNYENSSAVKFQAGDAGLSGDHEEKFGTKKWRDWKSNKYYTHRVEFGNGVARLYIDNVLQTTLEYTDREIGWRYLFIGDINYAGMSGPTNVTYLHVLARKTNNLNTDHVSGEAVCDGSLPTPGPGPMPLIWINDVGESIDYKSEADPDGVQDTAAALAALAYFDIQPLAFGAVSSVSKGELGDGVMRELISLANQNIPVYKGSASRNTSSDLSNFIVSESQKGEIYIASGAPLWDVEQAIRDGANADNIIMVLVPNTWNQTVGGGATEYVMSNTTTVEGDRNHLYHMLGTKGANLMPLGVTPDQWIDRNRSASRMWDRANSPATIAAIRDINTVMSQFQDNNPIRIADSLILMLALGVPMSDRNRHFEIIEGGLKKLP